MTTNNNKATPFPWRELAQVVCLRVDWTPIAASALDSEMLGGVVGSAVRLLACVLEGDRRRQASRAAAQSAPAITDDVPPPTSIPEAPDGQDASHDEHETTTAGHDQEMPVIVEAAELEAATLLGVQLDASEGQIRSAFRTKVKAAKASYIRATAFRTDPTDQEAEAAKKLIAAKQLLVERARAVRS